MLYIAVFVIQVAYVIIKFVHIRHIVGHSLKSRILVSAVANFVWLISTSLGVGSMINGDYFVVIPYMLASILGVVLEDKIRKVI